MTLSPQPTDNYVYDGNAEADLAEFLRFTGDHDGSSEGWGLYVEEEDEPAGPTKPFPVLEPRTIKIPALIVGKDSYGSNGKKFRYGPPPRYLPPMETGLLPGARVPWTLSPSDQAVSGPLPLLSILPASAFEFCVFYVCVYRQGRARSRSRPWLVKRLPYFCHLRVFVFVLTSILIRLFTCSTTLSWDHTSARPPPRNSSRCFIVPARWMLTVQPGVPTRAWG